MENIELDIRTLAYGPVAKYYDKGLWETDLTWYEEQGYKTYFFDASKWYTIDDFYSDLHEKFEFASYFGRNWGAVDDLISEVDRGKSGNVLVAIENYDAWYREDKPNAQIFLEVLADQTYSYLVHGRKLVTLIQSNDPKLNVKEVGSKRIGWNWVEWDNKKRGL